MYVVSHRSAFDDVNILGIYDSFERAAIIVDCLIQFREIRNSECIVIHRAALNHPTYGGLKEQCMLVNQYTTTFGSNQYQRMYGKIQKRKRSVQL